MSNRLLTGKVVQILNERELVINIGSDSRVQKGMLFKVMASAHPISLTDPDTGELLGSIDQEKIRVEAIEIDAKYTVCRTRSYRTPGGSFYNMASTLSGFNRPTIVHDTLKVADASYPEPLSPEDSIVQRGDRVVEVPKSTTVEEVIETQEP